MIGRAILARRLRSGWFAAAPLLLAACGGGLRPLPPATAPAPQSPPPAVAADAPRSILARPPNTDPLSDGVTDVDLDALWLRQLMVPIEGFAPSVLRNDYDARRGNRSHRALDMLAPKGTPILSADDGTIGRVDRTPLGGNIVYALDANNQFIYYYAHLDKHRKGLAPGDAVRKGDVIGYVGTTGNAPANTPHLHFQVMLRGPGRMWWDGPAINPWPFFVYSGMANQ